MSNSALLQAAGDQTHETGTLRPSGAISHGASGLGTLKTPHANRLNENSVAEIDSP